MTSPHALKLDAEGYVVPPVPLYYDDGNKMSASDAREIWWMAMPQAHIDWAMAEYTRRCMASAAFPPTTATSTSAAMQVALMEPASAHAVAL